jgi:hypothetical protein
MNLPFLSLIERTFPLHLQTGVPFAVVIVKSSPLREKAFSFMWRTCSSGKQNCGWTPRGGLKASKGAMLSMWMNGGGSGGEEGGRLPGWKNDVDFVVV